MVIDFMIKKLFISFFIIACWVLIFIAGAVFLIKNENISLVSPILAGSRLSIADNVWFPSPSEYNFSSDKKAPQITATAAFFVESQTGEVLYAKNAKEKYSIASLIKIMTSIITLEHKNINDVMVVSKRAAGFEPDKMFLKPNERLTVKELLLGIFLVSGNDAAEVLAEEVLSKGKEFILQNEGSEARRARFINLMNTKAYQLGMKDTYFINPTGLEEDGRFQYSTAYDVALMARYAIRKWPELIEISSKPYIYLPPTSDHQDYEMYSGINLLTTYPGVVGFKTGYTPKAGLTLVTVARRDGREVIGVLLGSTERREDAKKLLDYSFEKLGVRSKDV